MDAQPPAVPLECCVASAESALAAERGGARCLELCDNLGEGGTTPSAGMLRTVVARVGIPVRVLIRPRGGDFVWSADELEVQLQDVDAARDAGAAGVVVGALQPDGQLDGAATRALVLRARGGGGGGGGQRALSVTFHRAIDMCRDPLECLRALLAIEGIDRVLSSGGAATAPQGASMLAEMQAELQRGGHQLALMAGGGVAEDNAAALVRDTGVAMVHGTLRVKVDGAMLWRKEGVTMGSSSAEEEFARRVTSAERVAAVVAALAES